MAERCLRTVFISSILEDHGFDVHAANDAVVGEAGGARKAQQANCATQRHVHGQNLESGTGTRRRWRRAEVIPLA